MSTVVSLKRHWPWLLLAPLGLYAIWMASLVVPSIVRTVVSEVVRAVMGS